MFLLHSFTNTIGNVKGFRSYSLKAAKIAGLWVCSTKLTCSQLDPEPIPKIFLKRQVQTQCCQIEIDKFYCLACISSCASPVSSCALLMKSEDMKDEWEEADAKQQQQVEEHGESSFPHTARFREVVKFHSSEPTDQIEVLQYRVALWIVNVINQILHWSLSTTIQLLNGRDFFRKTRRFQ